MKIFKIRMAFVVESIADGNIFLERTDKLFEQLNNLYTSSLPSLNNFEDILGRYEDSDLPEMKEKDKRKCIQYVTDILKNYDEQRLLCQNYLLQVKS